jgi:hypothetical protein
VLLVLVSNPLELRVLVTFCHQIIYRHFHNLSSSLPPKTLAHICAWSLSEYSIDLSNNLFQSLVYKVFVLLLKKERGRKKKRKKIEEIPVVQKNLVEKESSCC